MKPISDDEKIQSPAKITNQLYKDFYARIYHLTDYVEPRLYRVTTEEIEIMYSTLIFAVWTVRDQLKLNSDITTGEAITNFFLKGQLCQLKSTCGSYTEFSYLMLLAYISRTDKLPIMKNLPSDAKITIEALNRSALPKTYSLLTNYACKIDYTQIISSTYGYDDFIKYLVKIGVFQQSPKLGPSQLKIQQGPTL